MHRRKGLSYVSLLVYNTILGALKREGSRADAEVARSCSRSARRNDGVHVEVGIRKQISSPWSVFICVCTIGIHHLHTYSFFLYSHICTLSPHLIYFCVQSRRDLLEHFGGGGTRVRKRLGIYAGAVRPKNDRPSPRVPV